MDSSYQRCDAPTAWAAHEDSARNLGVELVHVFAFAPGWLELTLASDGT